MGPDKSPARWQQLGPVPLLPGWRLLLHPLEPPGWDMEGRLLSGRSGALNHGPGPHHPAPGCLDTDEPNSAPLGDRRDLGEISVPWGALGQLGLCRPKTDSHLCLPGNRLSPCHCITPALLQMPQPVAFLGFFFEGGSQSMGCLIYQEGKRIPLLGSETGISHFCPSPPWGLKVTLTGGTGGISGVHRGQQAGAQHPSPIRSCREPMIVANRSWGWGSRWAWEGLTGLADFPGRPGGAALKQGLEN